MQILNLSPSQPDLIGAYIGNHVIVLCDTTAAAFTVTLPDAFSSQDVLFEIVNVGNKALTVQTIKSQSFFINYNETFSLTVNPTGCLRITSAKTLGKYIVLQLPGVMGNYPAGNYTAFEADGTLKMYGAATVYDDIQFPLVTARTVGTSDDPTWKLLENDGAGSTGIYAFSFSKTAKNQVWCAYEMPHCYKEFTALKIHYHFYPENNNTGDIVFEVEAGFNNVGEVLSPSVVYQYVYTVPANSMKKHIYVEVASVARTDLKISCGMGLRVCRRGDLAADTYDGECWITRAAIHIEKDTLGSRTESAK